jgi:hypothetical protein
MGAANGGLNMAEIDMTEPTVAPVEGDYGVDRGGVTRGPFVTRDSIGGYYPFGLDPHESGMGWTDIGKYYNGGMPDHRDIIAIIPAPDSVEPDATRETGVVVVETTRTTISHHLRKFSVSKLGNEFSIENEITGTLTSFDSPLAVAIARAILRMAGESK